MVLCGKPLVCSGGAAGKRFRDQWMGEPDGRCGKIIQDKSLSLRRALSNPEGSSYAHADPRPCEGRIRLPTCGSGIAEDGAMMSRNVLPEIPAFDVWKSDSRLCPRRQRRPCRFLHFRPHPLLRNRLCSPQASGYPHRRGQYCPLHLVCLTPSRFQSSHRPLQQDQPGRCQARWPFRRRSPRYGPARKVTRLWKSWDTRR